MAGYKTALELIATYGKDSKFGDGICPYGCDCPHIAQEALKEEPEDLKTEVLAFIERVMSGGWQYVENGQMFEDASELKKKLQ